MNSRDRIWSWASAYLLLLISLPSVYMLEKRDWVITFEAANFIALLPEGDDQMQLFSCLFWCGQSWYAPHVLLFEDEARDLLVSFRFRCVIQSSGKLRHIVHASILCSALVSRISTSSHLPGLNIYFLTFCWAIPRVECEMRCIFFISSSWDLNDWSTPWSFRNRGARIIVHDTHLYHGCTNPPIRHFSFFTSPVLVHDE